MNPVCRSDGRWGAARRRAAVLLTLAGAAGAVGSAWGQTPATQPTTQTADPALQAEGDRLFEEGKRLFEAREFERAEELFGQAGEVFERVPNPVDAARMYGWRGNCLRELTRYAGAELLYREALRRLRAIHGEQHPAVASSLNRLAGLLTAKSDYAGAEPLCREALAMRRKLLGAEHPDVATSLNNLAGLLHSKGDYASAEPLYREALAMRRKLLGAEHPDVATSLNNLAGLLESKGDFAEAESLFREALAMRRKLLGAEHPDVATSLNNLAGLLYAKGDYAGVEPLFREALAMHRKLLGAEHPDVATSLNNLALLLKEKGDYAAAEPLYREALAMRRKLLGAEHPDVADSLNNLAGLLRAKGDYAAAEPLHREALAMRRKLLGAEHPDVASSLNNLALLLDAKGDYAGAEPLYREALAMRRKLLGAEHPKVAASLNNLAALLHESGDYAGAEPLCREALAMHRKLLGAEHPDVATSLNNLALLLDAKGDYAGAEPLLREAVEIARRAGNDILYQNARNLAWMYRKLGRSAEAEPLLQEAIAHLTTLRTLAAGYGEEERGALFAHIERRSGTFQLMIAVQVSLGRLDEALRYMEMSRARAALDVLERGRIDLNAEVRRRAAADPTRRDEVERVLAQLGAVQNAANMLEHELAMLRGRMTALRTAGQGAGAEALMQEIDEKSAALVRAREQLLEAGGARFQLLRELVPIADTKDSATIRALLSPDERVLYYNVTDDGGLLLLVPPAGGEVRALPLHWRDGTPVTEGQLTERVDAFVARIVRRGWEDRRGRLEQQVSALGRPDGLTREQQVQLAALREQLAGVDDLLRGLGPAADRQDSATSAPAATLEDRGAELFAALLPAEAWSALRGVRRVYLVPQGALHRLPFEALVVARGEAGQTGGGRITYWLDAGPEIAYSPSGSVLHWLRERRRNQAATALESSRTRLAAALLVGDAIFARRETAQWPEAGAVVLEAPPGSVEARGALAADDVVLAYAGASVADDRALRDRIEDMVRSVEDGRRAGDGVAVRVWRGGVEQTLTVEPLRWTGKLARETPRAYFEARQQTIEQTLALGMRDGLASRYGSLGPLPGTRREVTDCAEILRSAGGDVAPIVLLGEDATQTRVFAEAPRARRLHLAVHGLADELQRASFSSLALTMPRAFTAGDNGFLSLPDLFERWRDHVPRCELVVLSACQTNIGPLQRDEAVFALPMGFFYAGAPAVVASLWNVADESTATLMTEFYRGMAAADNARKGGAAAESARGSDGAAMDQLTAFTAARKALRSDPRFAHPFYWAPFVYIGAPE